MIGTVLKAITENPLLHRVVYREVRRALPRRFPYKVLYVTQADGVQVPDWMPVSLSLRERGRVRGNSALCLLARQ